VARKGLQKRVTVVLDPPTMLPEYSVESKTRRLAPALQYPKS
jgi:hypothetical protein